MRGPKTPHEDAIAGVMLDPGHRFAVVEVTGLPWIEIDFAEDLVRANREILPRMSPVPAGATA